MMIRKQISVAQEPTGLKKNRIRISMRSQREALRKHSLFEWFKSQPEFKIIENNSLALTLTFLIFLTKLIMGY